MESEDRTVIRAVTLPVAEPVGRSWEELNAALKDCFRLSTDLANWCVHRLFALDTPGATEPDAVKKWYGYGDAGKNFPGWSGWAGNMAAAQCVIRAVHRKYRQQRFDVMVRHRSALLTYRYPYPFPVHNKDWKPSHDAAGFPVVSLPVPGLGRVDLRLRRRADFGRQLAMFRHLLDGTAKRGEAALYRDRKGNLLLKLVGRFPVEPRGARVRGCCLRTDPAALLVAQIDGRSPWVLNADHLRRWQAAHRAYRQRAAEDAKREKRADRRQRAHLAKSRDLRCGKHNDRLDTALHQLSAQVARFCERQGVACVVYDDANTDYIPDGFPWHALRTRIADKLAGVGVGFVGWADDGERISLNLEGAEKWDEMLKLATALATAGKRVVAGRRRSGSHPAVSAPRGTSSPSRATRSKTCSGRSRT